MLKLPTTAYRQKGMKPQQPSLVAVWRMALYLQAAVGVIFAGHGVSVAWDDAFNETYLDGLSFWIGTAVAVIALVAASIQIGLAWLSTRRLRIAAGLSIVVPALVAVASAQSHFPFRPAALAALGVAIILSITVTVSNVKAHEPSDAELSPQDA